MRHFLEEDAILSLNLFESFLHQSILLRFCLQVRSSPWAFIVDVTFHVLKLYLEEEEKKIEMD